MRFEDGMNAQPQVLAGSAEAVRSGLAAIAPLQDGQVVALVGIGASEHIVRSAAPAWRAAGIRAVAVSASELMHHDTSLADVYVALSESGRSAETVAALSHVQGRRIGVTNEAGSPLTEVVDEVLLLDSGPDSPVYTTGYTATLQAVGMLGDHWSGDASDWTAALPEHVGSVLALSEPVADALAKHFDEARIIDVVGSGVANATAGEGALVLREAARAHTSLQETYNYLHGPMEPLDAQSACIVVGDRREVQLAADVSTLGCQTLLITTRTDVPDSGHLTVVSLPDAGSPLGQAVLQILPIQALAWRLAQGRGLQVDGFRYRQSDTKLEDR
jgi:glucosamine--fructose-6-phosphate aminotransferase (isomerizing)